MATGTIFEDLSSAATNLKSTLINNNKSVKYKILTALRRKDTFCPCYTGATRFGLCSYSKPIVGFNVSNIHENTILGQMFLSPMNRFITVKQIRIQTRAPENNVAESIYIVWRIPC